MASNYPGSLDSFDTIASDKKTSDSVGGRTHRDMHNDLGDAVESIQGELGTNPSGSDATVAARLAAIEAGTNLGSGSVVEAKIASGAVTSAKIANDTIVDADINSAAAIARSKISGLPTSSTDNTIVRFDSTAGAMQTSGVVIDDNNRLTVATGATGGYGFASGAVHLTGTGSPEGVVSANPGSTWLDTSSTLDAKGWLRYVKASGTGNTGWIAGPESDTGWRNVTASLDSTFKTNNANATVLLRRVGDRVEWILNETVAGSTSGTATLWTTVPSGFRPRSSPGLAAVACLNPNSGLPISESLYINASSLYGFGWTAVRHFALLVHSTPDAWPSSLPGTAA